MRTRMSTKNTQMLNMRPKVVKVNKTRSKSFHDLDLNNAHKQQIAKPQKTPPVISEGLLSIEVTDTGCGMSKEEVKNLFQIFVQANRNVHHKFGGSGIGLWLSNKLITAMNGSIECISQPNKGSTFRINLPANSKTQPNDCYPSLFAMFKSFRVICLKKREKEVKNELTEIGFNVVGCEDMQELIETLKKLKQEGTRNYCLLIGYNKALKIKELINPSLTIIITSTLFCNSIERLIKINFPYVLGKPLNKYHLVSMLECIVKMQITREQAMLKQKNLEILVVDDNELCRNALTALISQYTSKLTVLEDAFKAIERLRIKNYDFAVIDQQMPGMTGLELVQKIRDSEEERKFIKPMTILRNFQIKHYIVLTGESSAKLEAEAKKVGVNAVSTF